LEVGVGQPAQQRTDSGVWHLHDGTTSVVVDARGPGLPAVVHWGAPLGEIAPDDLAALVETLAPPTTPGTSDVPAFIALLPDPGAGYPGRPGLRGHRAGRHWSPAPTLTEVSGHGAGTLHYAATDATAGLTVTAELELTRSGLLRLRHTVRNDGESFYTLDGLDAALPVPAQASELLDFTGTHCKERQPQRHLFEAGCWVREGRRGRTGHDATIGLLAGTPGFGFRHGEVWALHVAWSGNHVTYAEKMPQRAAVLGGGELLLPGEITLAPGAEYTTPWLFAGYSAHGMDGLSAAFHRWSRSRPLRGGRPRPVVLNTWEAVYFDHDVDRLRELADVAAGLGVERFVLDDGWFRRRRDTRAGLGDWFVDETVWPEGLHPLVKHVRGLGMEFGLWVEPEMVNPDSDLFRDHPEWALAPTPDRLPPQWRHQQVLDLANPDAFDHILGRLDALLSEYDIGYLKWDHNRDLVGAGHGGRAGVHAQTEAFYRLVDEVRARHPGLEIESCSSGGARVDLAVLERTDRVWPSDSNDALDRQAIQRWTGVFLPPELMGTHVGPPRSHTTGRTHDLPFRVATALFGHFGVEWDIASASEAERAALSAAITFYKEMRGLLHGGEVVRVDHPDPGAFVHGVVAPDASAALFCHARLAGAGPEQPVPVRLAGLAEDRRYRVRVVSPAGPPALRHPHPHWSARAEAVLSGAALTRVGVHLPVPDPEQALLLRLDAVD
jgi:alpha-galactosidase